MMYTERITWCPGVRRSPWRLQKIATCACLCLLKALDAGAVPTVQTSFTLITVAILHRICISLCEIVPVFAPMHHKWSYIACLLPVVASSQALEYFGADVGIAFSGAEDVALIEYAHLTGRPYRVFR